MTPEERAEKIVEKARAMNVELGGPVLFSMLSAQIREAVEEVEDASCSKCKRALGLYCRECFVGESEYLLGPIKKALKAEVYEDAAKIAEGEPDGYHDDVTIGQVVADKIRARARDGE